MNPEIQPYFSLMLFAGLWLFMSAFFSVISGWWALAQKFRASEKPDGVKVTSQVKQFGFVPENRITHMVVSYSGLYLYASLLFRFMHPALLIPWSKVSHPRTIAGLWWRTYEYKLDSTTIRVTQRAFDAIEQVRR